MNAIEHGNRATARSARSTSGARAADGVRRASGSPTSAASPAGGEPETPDLEAKLAGLQKPRGWGLFLIENMVDEMRVTSDGEHAHGRARPCAWKEMTMATTELAARCAGATGTAVIELAGDIDRGAEAALDAAWQQAVAERRRRSSSTSPAPATSTRPASR